MGDDRRARLQRARIYLCLPDRDDLAAFVAAVCAAGVDIVQLREKHLEARALIARARVARDAAHEHGALFVMNDRADLALASEADGVHVGQDDAPPGLCRSLLGDELLVGMSTHAPDELTAALDEPVDYVSVGPIVPTPTKPGRAGTGLGYVRFAARTCGGLPFFVSGGITPDTIDDVAAAGGRRFVVVRAITEAGSPREAAAVVQKLTDRVSGLPLHPPE